MIQCFLTNKWQSIFENGKIPQLVSASKIDFNYTIHPRLLHSHKDRLEILYVRSGTGIYIVEEKRYSIQSGDIIICNKEVLHDENPNFSEDLNTYCITLTNVNIKGLPENCLIDADTCPHIQTLEYSIMLEQLFSTVYALLASNSENIEQTCSYIAIGILTFVYEIILEQKIKDKKESKKINLLSREIKQYIDIHYDEDLTLNSISEALHINPYYVAHVFKDNIGYSPIQYILRRRIGEAQSLLIHTDYSITTIASMVGYNNISHFNSMFLKYIKMSPSEYRKNYTNKNYHKSKKHKKK